VNAILDREMNPATPPWLTIRFWLTIVGLVISIVALAMTL
jgi:hypothetical protein